MSVASKIPPLRFKGFDGAWTDVRLGEIGGSWFKGQPLSKNELSDDGQNKCIHYGELFTIYGAVIENVSSTTNVLRRIGSKEGDLLFPASDVTPDGLGRCSALFVDGVLLGGDLIGFRQNEVDSQFLSYAINNCRDQIVQLVTGTTVRHSSAEKLKSVVASISVNRAEQQKIGLTFRSLDALIADRESAVEKLKTLKKAMLEKMFPRAGAKVPEVRFKGCEGEWKEKRLGDSVRFAKGKGYSKSDIQEEGTPLFLYGRMYTDYQIEVDRVDTFCVQRNGSVLSVGNEVVCPASGETAEDIACASAVKEKGIVLGGDLNILVPHANSGLDPTFLAMSLTYGSGRAKIVERAQGKTVVHIHNSDLEDVVVLSPSLLEQRKIGAYFRSLDALISARQEEVGKLKDLKKALLDRMFV